MPPENLTPSPDQPTNIPSTYGWLRQRRTWVIVVMTLAIITVGVLVLKPKNAKVDQTTTSSQTQYDREGYNRAELPGSIGDPEAIVGKAASSQALHQGTAVISACNILKLSELRQQKLHLTPNPLASVIRREYIDGQGQGAIKTNDYNVSGNMTNQCNYGLHNSGTIDIRVYQVPLVTTSGLNRYISLNFNAIADINNIKAWQGKKSEREGQFSYLIRQGNVAAELLIRPGTTSPEQTAQAVLATAAKNLSAEVTRPSGPMQFSYDSPIFKKTYANGCNLVSAADITTLFGVEADPFVKESLASAVGIINFESVGGTASNFNYIDHQCSRYGSISDLSKRQTLEISTMSYLSEEPAKTDFSYDKNKPENQTRLAQIGNEATASTDAFGSKNTIIFRQGRFIVKLSLYDRLQSLSSEQITAKLTPIAQKIAAELKAKN